ncbi:MAG TPA: DUF3999 family protein [Candidatus Angelobacter sp.]|nr:DUF3999 family protein [Candidatus Angelobacter sp.]
MKSLWLLAALAMFAAPTTSHFKYQRPVQASGTGQHYLVVDETVWKHARPDLGDVRLHSGETEIPYAMTTERGALRSESRDVRVLQPGRISGRTQFYLDMSGLAEYDHIDVRLATRNYVAHVRAEGHDDLHTLHWADLGGTIFYDLSRETLGGNTTLRLPLTTYKYLRITIDGPVAPSDVLGAYASVREEEKAVWREVGSPPKIEQLAKETVVTFTLPEKVPVERVSFGIDSAQPSFRRVVEIQNDKKQWLGSGELSRIHMVRLGEKIDSEQSQIEFSTEGQGTVRIVIHNGDDQPLKITGARLEQFERRVYFDVNPSVAAALAATPIVAYYGDEKVGPPEYDYGKLFQKDSHALAASWGKERANPGYTERPDERPWSERNPALLWVAIIAAVVVLGAIALRSLRAPGVGQSG